MLSSGERRQFYVADLGVELTQPLLRDFGNEINRARIDINKNNQHISVLEFRNTLEDQLTKLEQTYWQLVQAQREVEIQQELLQRTIDTAVILALRQNQDVTRVQLAQANFAIEQRRAQLVRARARVADLSDQMKVFMNDPSVPAAGQDLVLPSTPPVLDQIIYSPHDVVVEANRYRPEVGQQLLRVDSALIALNVAKNNKLPRLDLTGRVSVQQVNASSMLSPVVDLFDVEQNWQGAASIQFQFEYPLGNRAALAIEKRAGLQYEQALVQYHQLSLKVTNETTQALREVDTTYNEIARTKQERFAAAEALRALQVREDNNEPLTPQFVDQKLRQQEQLAQAQRDEAAAISNYNIALATLERAKGTLLRYNNVTLQEESLTKK
ncbi:MAG: TolC family protein [Tepidisphaeraceae bacterium]